MTKEKFDKEYKAESDITIDLTKEEKKSWTQLNFLCFCGYPNIIDLI
jgi:hypothetical protein